MLKKTTVIVLALAVLASPALAQNRFEQEAKENAARRAENKSVREAEHPEDSATAKPAPAAPAPAQTAAAPAAPAQTAAAPAAPAAPVQADTAATGAPATANGAPAH